MAKFALGVPESKQGRTDKENTNTEPHPLCKSVNVNNVKRLEGNEENETPETIHPEKTRREKSTGG